MLNITIFDVMEQHITNEEVRVRMKSYSMEQTIELRRPAQWLEKISHMGSDRGPRKILVAWMMNNALAAVHSKGSDTDWHQD
jgi:hypothetical protein